ncbi:class I glutamine amidotransferase-like protein [Zalerion maritima]|uniref:Class I glutamine amidotransferase-like protein n=1 Tax=Zalerion maritima TaxID=339359 RepID=A0AAD5RQQ8_9PEZI|nr:class I glutamine amidotransferase-like protein [Zalerion maritima]
MHRDIVFASSTAQLPEGVEVLASNDVCQNQGMRAPGKLITVQGHPEFNETIVNEILELRHGTGILGDELYEGGMKRVGWKHDGVGVAKAFLKFCKE